MLTVVISTTIGAILGLIIYFLVYDSVLLAALVAVAVILGMNVLVGRRILKLFNELGKSVEGDLKSEKFDLAVDKLKNGYKYAKWQFFLKNQIDSQIGSIYYVRKRFEDAIPYLKNAFKRQADPHCMLAAYYYKKKNYMEAFKIMERTITYNAKEPFAYILYGWFLAEQEQADKAIKVLTKGSAKIPLNEKLSSALEAVKNHKKIKIQNCGMQWIQLHLGKTQEGVKSYQALAGRVKRR